MLTVIFSMYYFDNICNIILTAKVIPGWKKDQQLILLMS